MDLLSPDWNQLKPSREQAWTMCQHIPLAQVLINLEHFESALNRLRTSHSNGGVVFGAFQIPHKEYSTGLRHEIDCSSSISCLASWLGERSKRLFQYYPSRNFRRQRSALRIVSSRMRMVLKCQIRFSLMANWPRNYIEVGAYSPSGVGDGREEKEAAMQFCNAMFGLRFSELLFYVSYRAWTPWFEGIAWDWTAVLFDRRFRYLWLLAVTDTD